MIANNNEEATKPEPSFSEGLPSWALYKMLQCKTVKN